MHLSRVLVDRKIAHLQLGLSMPFICDPQVTLRLACGSPKWVPYACDFLHFDCCDITVLICAVHVFEVLTCPVRIDIGRGLHVLPYEAALLVCQLASF